MDNQFVPRRRKKHTQPDLNITEAAPTDINKPAAEPGSMYHQYDYFEPSNKPADKTEPDKKEKKKLRQLKLTKKGLLIALCLIVVFAGAGLLLYKHFNKSSLNIQTSKIDIQAKPVSKTVPSDLSGLQVDPSLNKIPVTAVMIENSLDARPQSGLSQAMVVFEAVAEGGVTRFMALFQDTSPSSVGPIRSARPYYVSWAMGFDAGYAHVGGSPDALSDITSWGTRDLNQFANGSYYTRVSTRAAPHNVYTSISELNQLEDKKGYTSSTFTTWARQTTGPLAKPTVTAISMNLSGAIYNPSYAYNATANSYERSENGASQIDAINNQQIDPKIVIAIVVPESQGALDATGAYYSNYNVIGSNTAYVFQNGGETTGTWTKSSNNSNIVFTTSSGQPLTLDPGQVWVTAITSSGALKYS